VPAPATTGNLFEPMPEGTQSHGGWGGSRAPDRIAGAAAAGLVLLPPTIALLASDRARAWVSEMIGRRPRRRGPTEQIRSLVRPLGRALGVS
jgi:hypothetical protein